MENKESNGKYLETFEEVETLEDVQKLTVKTKDETLTEDEFPDKKEKDISDSAKENNLPETESGQIQTKHFQKDEESSQNGDEEVAKEVKRRDKMKLLLTGYLEMKTKKEIEKALLNEKKIIAQWLYPFRKTYQKEWELEMKKLKIGFQKALEFKKARIHAIQQERKLVEMNHLWADSSHYRVTEELFDFLRMRCSKLETRYLEELEETKEYYLEREKEIVNKCTKAEERAEALAFMRKSVHDKILKKTNETLERFKNESEFLKEKEIELIKEKHLTYVELLAKEFQTSISPPEHKIEEVRALFLEWKLKYEGYVQVSEKSKKKLEHFNKELPELEAKVATARKQLEDLRNENKMAKEKGIKEITTLQKEARKGEELNPSLRKMISASEEVMVQLRERKSKLEKIMKLKKLCDKLETENDKIVSEVNFLNADEIDQLKEIDCLPMIREMCSGDIEDLSLMQNLHRKLSRVKLQNQFLLHNIENLKIENKALKSDMKKFLHLISTGKWNKVTEEDFIALYELSGEFQNTENVPVPTKSDASKRLDKNLKLLDGKFGQMNKKIVNHLDVM